MPEVEYSTDVAAPLPFIWDFVRDMDNWAPFLTGYQRHEKINDDESIWYVKGELAGLTRVAEFRVHVTEWKGPGSVTFTMEGLQEPVNGSGAFLAYDLTESAATPAPLPLPEPAPKSWLAGLWERILRRLLRRVTSSVDIQQPVQPSGPAASRISFRLKLHAGGATGPVLNILLAPMLKPVAEDLALKIAAAVTAKYA